MRFNRRNWKGKVRRQYCKLYALGRGGGADFVEEPHPKKKWTLAVEVAF